MGKIIKRRDTRSANFTLHERDILVSLVQKYESVIENKYCDALTGKKKEAVWESIEKEFNARSGSIFRSNKTLKIKYEALKRTVRKKSAALRSELLTEGDQNTALPLDSVEKQIKAMITGSHRLEVVNDCDILPESEESKALVLPKEIMYGNSTFTYTAEVVESEATQNDVVVIVSNERKPWRFTPSAETVPEEENINQIIENDKALRYTPSNKCVITPITSANKKWNVTRRRNFKSRKHPALISRT